MRQAPEPRRRQPPDQADGLRQLFAANDRRVIALVHNPFVAFAGVAMERLASALAAHGLHTLVVDAADTASVPHELADVDLGACVEPLSPKVSYLAARGLPLRWIDSRGSTAGFLDALRLAAPHADVVLLHAGAGDLRRALMGQPICPLVLTGTHADSLTHAYASIKLLAQRAGVAVYDLAVVAETDSNRARASADRLARRLSDCGERFLGVAMRCWTGIDPAGDVGDPTSSALDSLLSAQLQPHDLAPLPTAVLAAAGRDHARLN